MLSFSLIDTPGSFAGSLVFAGKIFEMVKGAKDKNSCNSPSVSSIGTDLPVYMNMILTKSCDSKY